jgi:hypothetical protein
MYVWLLALVTSPNVGKGRLGQLRVVLRVVIRLKPDITMSKKRSMERGRTRLKWGLERASEELEARVKAGRDLRLPLNPTMMLIGGQMETAGLDFKKWDDFNYEMLRSMFTSDEVADSYFNASPHYIRSVSAYPVSSATISA